MGFGGMPVFTPISSKTPSNLNSQWLSGTGMEQLRKSLIKLDIFDWGLNIQIMKQKAEVDKTRTMISQSPPSAVTWKDNTLVSKFVQLKMNGNLLMVSIIKQYYEQIAKEQLAGMGGDGITGILGII